MNGPPPKGRPAAVDSESRATPDSRFAAFRQDCLVIDAPSVSLERQLTAIRREIKMRRQRYPRLVAVRRLSVRKAAEEIAVMQAIETTLLELIGARR